MKATNVLEIDAGTADELDLRQAIEDEKAAQWKALPPDIALAALSGNEDKYAERLKTNIQAGYRLSRPETLAVNKAPRGLRPVPVLHLDDRIIYRALSNRTKALLPPNSRAKDYQGFRDAPLADDTATHVAQSDVVAFYQYIDHELLETEIINQTGDGRLAHGVADLLEGLVGRGFGLPQGYDSSIPLAELVVDIAERRMLRRGFGTWHYSDDFVVAARSREEALRALEALDGEVRALGLTINEEKTAVRTVAAYADWIGALETTWQQYKGTAFDQLAAFDPYKEQEVIPADEDVSVEAARAYLERWTALADAGIFYGLSAVVNRKMLSHCLRVMAIFSRTDGLAYCERLLRVEPSLVPRLSEYFAAVAATDAEALSTAVDGLIQSTDLYLSDWQALWLLEAIRSSSTRSDVQIAWAKKIQARPNPGIASAHAALLLAEIGETDIETLGQMAAVVPLASQPVLVSAITRMDLLQTTPLIASLSQDNYLNQLVVEASSDLF